MIKLLVAAAIGLTPGLALAQVGSAGAAQPPLGSGSGECDSRWAFNLRSRPDCLGYNPFYTGPGAIGHDGFEPRRRALFR